MALADLDIVKKRVISILNAAGPGAYSATVATGGNTVGAFPSNDEILQAILEADEMVATEGYFQSANDSLANPFNVTTSALVTDDDVPFHHGDLSRVQLSGYSNTFGALSAPNIIEFNAPINNLQTGTPVTVITTGTLPTGLSITAQYYYIANDDFSGELASSRQNAFAGTPVAISAATGSGLHTLLTWSTGILAQSLDDILNGMAVGNTYVGGGEDDGAFNFLYFPNDGRIYSSAPYWRVTYPQYTRTTTLQCDQNEEFLIIATAVRILTKNASPAPFEYYANESIRGIQQLVTDGVYTTQMESNN